MDASKLRTGEITAALGGLALFIILFFNWVGAEGSDEGLSGWDYLGGDVTGFIVFLAATVAMTLGVLASLERRRPMGNWPWGGPTTALGVLAFDIVIWRLFTVPDGGELKVGIFLGLIAAGAIAVGGYLTLREGGRDLLAGGAPARRSSGATTTKAVAKKPAAKRKAKARAR